VLFTSLRCTRQCDLLRRWHLRSPRLLLLFWRGFMSGWGDMSRVHARQRQLANECRRTVALKLSTHDATSRSDVDNYSYLLHILYLHNHLVSNSPQCCRSLLLIQG
jgi:hypothetical protein